VKFETATDAEHGNAVAIDPNAKNFAKLIDLVLPARPALRTRAIMFAFGMRFERDVGFGQCV
jgi:hypothetical protein